MRIEMLPGLTNVIRFPVELRVRPSLGSLREIAPDAREVLAIAEAFGMDAPPHDLRHQVDAETAAHIASYVPAMAPAAEREAVLAGMLDPTVERAMTACRAAHDLAADAATARHTLLDAQIAGGYWLDPLRERAEALTERAAARLLEAHVRVEQAEGVARAVGLARRGEFWTLRDHRAEEEALFAMADRHAG